VTASSHHPPRRAAPFPHPAPARPAHALTRTRRAIENGANALAEGFLFAVAASLVIAETWRSSRSSTKRREAIDDAVDSLDARLSLLSDRVEEVAAALDARWALEHARNDELVRVLERVLALDMAGGGARTPDGERLLESVRLPPVVPPELRVGSGRPVTNDRDALAASDADAPARAGEEAALHSS
jgi:hypothetical protein